MKKCTALIKENYVYHLSGDCSGYCICAITKKPCLGRIVSDPDDQSSQFFSRAKCSIDDKKIESCPLYGADSSVILKLIEERLDREKNKMMDEIRG